MSARRPRALAALALAVALGTAGCGQGGGDAPASGGAGACACEAAPVVDPVLLAFLSKARAAHHQADVAEAGSDRAGAIAALDGLVSGPQPPAVGGAVPPEVAEVIADTRARLADLRSSAGDFDRAAKDIEEGLRLATGVTHFRGHLAEVRGLIEERRSIALKERGDAAGSETARRAAIAAYQEAIEIQDEVISRVLGDAGAPASPGAPR